MRLRSASDSVSRGDCGVAGSSGAWRGVRGLPSPPPSPTGGGLADDDAPGCRGANSGSDLCGDKHV